MAVVNIPRDVKDQFYRYKMPAIIAKVEGRGNGIKTVIVNMTEVAKSLERPPAYITKYFGFELGAIATIDPAKDRYVVNGKHDQSKLATVLDGFIEKFVLCKLCTRNPETKMAIHGGAIELRCKACGGVSEVGMSHKLTTYIIKNPPPSAPGDKPKKTREKKDKKKEESDEDPEEDFEIEAKKADEVAKKTPKKQKDGEDDVVWYTDTSKEAAEQRRQQMLDENEFAAKVFVTDTKVVDPFTKLSEFVATKPNDQQLISEVEKYRSTENWGEEQTAAVVTELLFNQEILAQLKTSKAQVLKKFVTSSASQKGVLGSLVEILSAQESSLKISPHVLKTLYDMDLLEEEAILSWSDGKKNSAAKKVNEAAKVFIDWLRSAEEESDEDDEDDEDDDDEEEEDDAEEDDDDEEEEDEDEEEDESEEEEVKKVDPKKPASTKPEATKPKAK